MIATLVAIYRRWPLRPHCGSARHTVLCRLAAPLLRIVDGPRCGNFDG
jgi:hypothetical protein